VDSEKKAEHVEHIVAVVSEGKRVHNGIEMDHGKHERNYSQGCLE
jgi:hypothetical protein